MSDRRDLIKKALAGAAGRLFIARLSTAETFAADEDPWARVPEILKRIKAPVFPKRDFEATKYGARGDGKFDNTEAFRKAVAACNKAGGGRVVVPAGTFLTGPVDLFSNVNLH